MNVDDIQTVLDKWRPLYVQMRKLLDCATALNDGETTADLTPVQVTISRAVAGYLHLPQMIAQLTAERASLEGALKTLREKVVSS